MSKKWFVVSDTHSFYTELIKALNSKNFDVNNKNHYLVLAGDLFDRGPQSVKLFNFVKSLGDRFIYVRGNHEDLLFDCVEELKQTQGCAGYYHYCNGTVQTVQELKNANILDEVLNFIQNKSIDYFKIKDYIICHGWVPLKADYDSNNTYKLALNEDASERDWKKARWLKGMQEWKRDNFIEGKTIICGHWHCSYGNSHYHINEHLKEWPQKNRKNWKDSFKPFIDEGIIAIDACTAYSHLVNIFIIDE